MPISRKAVSAILAVTLGAGAAGGVLVDRNYPNLVDKVTQSAKRHQTQVPKPPAVCKNSTKNVQVQDLIHDKLDLKQ